MFFEEKIKKIEEWQQKQGWEVKNPFTHVTMPELFVGFEDILSKVYSFIELNKNYAVIYGQYGFGKTALIKKIAEDFKNKYNVILFEEPPEKTYLIKKIKELCGNQLLQKIGLIRIDENDYEKINKQIRKKTLLIIDEAHALDEHIFSYLRNLSESGTSFSIIFAGKTELVKGNKKIPEYLIDRLELCESLRPLTEKESIGMIKKRIEVLAKSNNYLFTENAMKKIAEHSKYIPREIIENCSRMIEFAIENNKHEIRKEDVERFFKMKRDEATPIYEPSFSTIKEELKEEPAIEVVEEKTSTLEKLVEGEPPKFVPKQTYNLEKHELLTAISPLQRRILLFLFEEEPKTAVEIAKSINDKYDTVRHMLKRLQGKYNEPQNRPTIKDLYPLIEERENMMGRGYIYSLSPHVRKILSSD